MAKLMRKWGETTAIQYDEKLFKSDSTAYEVLDSEEAAPVKPAKKKVQESAPSTLEGFLNSDLGEE